MIDIVTTSSTVSSSQLLLFLFLTLACSYMYKYRGVQYSSWLRRWYSLTSYQQASLNSWLFWSILWLILLVLSMLPSSISITIK